MGQLHITWSLDYYMLEIWQYLKTIKLIIYSLMETNPRVIYWAAFGFTKIWLGHASLWHAFTFTVVIFTFFFQHTSPVSILEGLLNFFSSTQFQHCTHAQTHTINEWATPHLKKQCRKVKWWQIMHAVTMEHKSSVVTPNLLVSYTLTSHFIKYTSALWRVLLNSAMDSDFYQVYNLASFFLTWSVW